MLWLKWVGTQFNKLILNMYAQSWISKGNMLSLPNK